MTEAQRPPRDNLVRAAFPGPEFREEGNELSGHFAVFNQWTEINSAYEGRFMEMNEPGAFTKTLAENRSSMRILLNHGKDPELGDKPIATPDDVGEDEVGGYYRGQLLDGVPTLVRSGLAAGLYGSSYRFGVVRDEWNPKAKKSDWNPSGLPERRIKEARVFEFGPVTFPAYATATATVRSMTDDYLRDILVEPAPSVDAEAEPHLEPERRDDPPDDPPPSAAPVETNDPPEGGSSDSRSTPVEYVTRDEKAARIVEIRAEMNRLAVASDGELPETEQREWDGYEEELASLERAIAAWDARQAKLRSFAGEPGKTEAGIPQAPTFVRKATVEDIHDLGKIREETRSRTEFVTKVKENALRSIDGARVPRGADLSGLADIVANRDEGEEDEGEIARRILLTGSPAYKRAFNKYLRGESAVWSPEESRAAALAVTGTTTTGGYAVPYVFDPTLIHIGVHTTINPYRAACRVETITNGNNWRAVTTSAITAAYATEAAAASEGGPTIGQPSYTVQRAQAFATVSIETLQDRPDIGAELSGLFAEAKDTLEENQFSVGVGTTVYPFGMFTDAAFTNVDTATNDVTALADMTALEAALPLRHRARAAYFMSRSTLRQLLVLDTAHRYFSGVGINYAGQGNPSNASPVGNTGISLLGYPVWEVPSAVSTLTTDGAIIVVFGDPSNYVIVDRLGLNVEVIQNMLNGATPSFPTGQRGIYCYWRNTARPINADGMRSLSVQ